MAVHELFAYICVKDTSEAIAFYGRAFGATEKFRLTEPSGRIGHAEVDLNGTTLMLCDEFPEYGIAAPQPGQRTSVTIHIHVDNADEVISRRSPPARRSRLRRRMRSTASDRERSAIRSGTAGTSATTSRTSRPTRCSGVTRACAL